MESIIKKLREYLNQSLGVIPEIQRLNKNNRLPFYLVDRFKYYSIKLYEKELIIIIPREKNEITPAGIAKDIMKIREILNLDTILVDDKITSYNRKRLVQHKVPFIIPMNQLYLPSLGIDFHEYFLSASETISQFSPSAQIVILHSIINNNYYRLTSTNLANSLGYSVMTFTRSLKEIEALDVGYLEKAGKEKILNFYKTGKELWERSKAFMRNPVKRKINIAPILSSSLKIISGESALAKYSMLNEPTKKVYAVSLKKWEQLKVSNEIKKVPSNAQDAIEVEIWWYDPELFTIGNAVDKLSLYLNLCTEKDERVQSALNEMMGTMEW